MQLIYTAQNEMDATFLKGLLVQEGIPAVVQGGSLEQVWGTLPLGESSLLSVWVPDEDVARAMAFVADYNQKHEANQSAAADAPRPTWVCPRCGEKVEEQFTQCWHCGTTRKEPAPVV